MPSYMDWWSWDTSRGLFWNVFATSESAHSLFTSNSGNVPVRVWAMIYLSVKARKISRNGLNPWFSDHNDIANTVNQPSMKCN